MKYNISIIIPTYNTGKFLHESIDSLIKQTIGFENIEVLIVDDKSTDQYTINLINVYSEKYSNIKAIFLEENSGFPGHPRNIGIENSTADYVMVMDHDDSYQPTALKTMYNNALKDDADVTICNYNKIYGEKIEKTPHIFTQPVIKTNNIEENLELFKIPPSIWTRLYNKKFLQDNNIKFPEGMLAEDLYVNTYTLLKAQKIVYLNNYYGYNYKIRDTEEDKSTIHIRNKKYLNAMIQGYYKIWNILKETESNEYYPIIFQDHIIYWITSFIKSNTNTEEKKELVKNIMPILQEQIKYTNTLNERIYEPLIKPILGGNVEKFIEITTKIGKQRKRKEKIKRIFNKFKLN